MGIGLLTGAGMLELSAVGLANRNAVTISKSAQKTSAGDTRHPRDVSTTALLCRRHHDATEPHWDDAPARLRVGRVDGRPRSSPACGSRPALLGRIPSGAAGRAIMVNPRSVRAAEVDLVGLVHEVASGLPVTHQPAQQGGQLLTKGREVGQGSAVLEHCEVAAIASR